MINDCRNFGHASYRTSSSILPPTQLPRLIALYCFELSALMDHQNKMFLMGKMFRITKIAAPGCQYIHDYSVFVGVVSTASLRTGLGRKLFTICTQRILDFTAEAYQSSDTFALSTMRVRGCT